MFLLFNYYEQCPCEHCYTSFYVDMMFSFSLGNFLGVELLDHMIPLFNLLRNWQTVLQSSCTILYSHQQCMWVLTLHSCQHLSLAVFLSKALSDVKWFFVVLICISLIIKWCWISFHVLIDHVYIFSGRMSIQILCSLRNWVVVVLWVFYTV